MKNRVRGAGVKDKPQRPRAINADLHQDDVVVDLEGDRGAAAGREARVGSRRLLFANRRF